MRNRRGTTLIDVMVGLVLLTVAGLVYSATFPAGFRAVRQGGESKKAVAIAQAKIEQVKLLGYENLNYETMQSQGVIDSASATSPFVFTSVESLTTQLPNPTGTLAISDYSVTTKLVVVTVNWRSDSITRSVTLRTLVADKSTYRGS